METNKEKIVSTFPSIQAKMRKLTASLNVKGTFDLEDRETLKEVLDWLDGWGVEQDRLYEERTGQSFPKLTGIHK